MAAQTEVRFITKQLKYAVPNTPFTVPSVVNYKELNSLINELLKAKASEETWQEVDFDFLVCGEVLRIPLSELLEEHSISNEVIVDIEYFERVPAPKPQDCLLHDDWVSTVHVRDKWILSGCYDNTLHIWTTKGKHQLTIPAHTAPVKAVSWISMNDTLATFVSASQDQTVMLWQWNMSTNAVECIHVCRGHERGVECVGISPCEGHMATGGWDTNLKIWSSDIYVTSNEGEGSASKRIKTDHGKSSVRTPLMTLKGHKEAISSIQWTDAKELCTTSWDHTIRLWDVEVGGITNEIIGNKPFFGASWSTINKLLITASSDRHIRLYDPRSKQGSLVMNIYTSHTQWVQSVRWSTTKENLFISGSHDQLLKLWDSRSPKAPLFDLRGHDGKVLCCDWSNPEFMVSGGTDNTVRIFSSNLPN